MQIYCNTTGHKAERKNSIKEKNEILNLYLRKGSQYGPDPKLFLNF